MNNQHNLNSKQKNEPTLLTAAILADLHLDDDTDDRLLTTALDNISKMSNVSALIIPGDINDGPQKGSGSAHLDRKKAIFDIIKNHFPEKYHHNVMVTLGNHDIRWFDDEKDIDPETLAFYKDINENTFGISLDDTHCFDKKIDDCYFICLNSISGEKDEIHLSPASFTWLEKKITDYVKTSPDKPFFIVMHQPLHRTHWCSDLCIVKELLEQDEQLKTLFSRYPQLVVISGHIHNGFGVIEFMQRPFGTLVDAPSLTRQESGDIRDEQGTGWLMHVYADKLVFEAWNFTKNLHYPKYDQLISLPQLPVMCGHIQQLLQNPDTDIDTITEAEGLLYRATQIMGKEYVNNTLAYQRPDSISPIFGVSAWKEISVLRDDIDVFLKKKEK